MLLPLVSNSAGFAEIGFLLLVLLVLICLSGIISGSEVAFFSLSPIDFENLSNDKSKSSDTIIRLIQKPKQLLATILVANNFVNIAIVIISEIAISKILSREVLDSWSEFILNIFNVTTVSTMSGILQFLITVVGVTTILVLFGEILPKIYAKLNNIKLSKFTAPFIMILQRMLSPVTTLLVSSTGKLEHRLSHSSMLKDSSSKMELSKAIDLAVHEGEKNEIEILKGIINFGEVHAKEIMKPRNDVIALDISADFDELKTVVKDSGYSRIPIYEEDFDNIKGILYVKDILLYLDESSDFKWQDLIRSEVKYVPELKKIGELLKEFQSEKKHISIIVDEFGGSSGIITLEDILEEIIGEIKDEFDDDDNIDYQQIDENTFIFDGKTRIKDLCKVMHLNVHHFDDVKGDSDSVAGLILEFFGKFPRKNVDFRIADIRFKVLSLNKRRLERIQVKK